MSIPITQPALQVAVGTTHFQSIAEHCYDVEVYSNYVCVGFIDLDGNVTQFSTLRDNIGSLAGWWDAHRSVTCYGFNSAAYDDHILSIILQGCHDPSTIYRLSVERIAAREKFPTSPMPGIIDMRAVLGGDNVGSLKELGVKLNYPVLRELPYRYDTILTDAQAEEVEVYNVNDLRVTLALRQAMDAAFEARKELKAKYGVDVMGTKDSGIAKTILRTALFNDKERPPIPTKCRWKTSGAAIVHSDIGFVTPGLQEMLSTVQAWQLDAERVRDGEGWRIDVAKPASLEVRLDEVTYSVGLGGLHSKDTPNVFRADAEFEIVDIDVQSYYPALIKSMKLCPAHLAVQDFQKEFCSILDERVRAKRAGQKALNLGLKIAINSVFGGFGSAYGWLRDPVVGWTVTVNGQLILLMLIELLVTCEYGKVLSANTDGIVLRIRRADRLAVEEAVQEFQSIFGLVFEFSDHQVLARRDINNYVSIDPHGKVTGKGAYAYDPTILVKRAVERVVIDAVQKYFVDGTPVYETITACRDVTQYIDYFKTSSGYHLVDDDGRDIGSLARWVRTTSGTTIAKVKGELRATITSNQPVTILADLPDELPRDIEIQHYVAQAEALIAAIEQPEVSLSTSVAIADMTREQLDIFRHNHSSILADDLRVACFSLTETQATYDGAGKSQYDTMKRLLVQMWIRGEGHLNRGDLLGLAERLDNATGYFTPSAKRRSLLSMVEWVARNISPFPRELSDQEIAERAIQWARLKISPSDKGKRVTAANLVLASTRMAYAKAGDRRVFANAVARRAIHNHYSITVIELEQAIQRHAPNIEDESVNPVIEPKEKCLPEIAENMDRLAATPVDRSHLIARHPLVDVSAVRGGPLQRITRTFQTFKRAHSK